jgi:predicted Zn-dependent protease
MWIKLIRDAVIVIGVFALVWYVMYLISSDKKLDNQFFSEDQLEKVEEWISSEIERSYPPLRENAWEPLLQEMASRLEKGKPEYSNGLRIVVLDEAQPNAFATIGGRIYVFKGIIELCDSPEELYAILAHEFGHIFHNHVERKILTEFSLAIILGGMSGGDVLLASEIARTLSSGAFSRLQERKADEFALDLMKNTGVDPSYLGIIFRKLKDYSGDPKLQFEMLSTHPDIRKRIQKALEYDKEGLEIIPFKNSLERTIGAQ